jgi:hypothetical protein
VNELARVNPELSEGEAQRLALLAHTAPAFVPKPDAGLSAAAAFQRLRGEPWATH